MRSWSWRSKMVKHSQAWLAMRSKTCALTLLALLSLSTLTLLFLRTTSDSCTQPQVRNLDALQPRTDSKLPNPLEFMKSKLVLMVSHELSLSGGPLLLMELAFLLRSAGSDVVWITNQKPPKPDDVIYTLENKMLDRGVQVLLKQSTKLNTLFFLTLFSN